MAEEGERVIFWCYALLPLSRKPFLNMMTRGLRLIGERLRAPAAQALCTRRLRRYRLAGCLLLAA